MEHPPTHSTGTEAATDDHFPRRMCLKDCCSAPFMENVDAGLAHAARVSAEAVA